jgi:hypothetical protein
MLALERGFARAVAVRDELLLAYSSEAERRRITEAIYAAESGYMPGGDTFERGLLGWEEELLAESGVSGGRVLLGGAGAGRELSALGARGFQVTAFEPCEALMKHAQALAPPGSRVLRSRYEELDPSLFDDAPYALVLLGWRSLSHVIEERDRLALFAALRRLAPDAPVIASFMPRTVPDSAGRLRMRAVLKRLGARRVAEGSYFLPHAGFVVTFDAEDLARMAEAGGYRIVRADLVNEGYALLTPAK